jgi:DNA repair exonuclease SbcCD nuclease subunit
MKFVHISDSHLGASTFSRRIAPSGYNQREEDICNAFIAAIDKILKLKPEFVLHSGDLFHSVRPTNRILHFGLEQVLRLTQADIPVVIISGNHDAPKQKGVGSIFKIFTLFPNLYPVFDDKYEKKIIKNTAIHAVPQCIDNQTFQKELEKVEIDKDMKFNILLLHGVVAGIPEFSMGELSEQEIKKSCFKPEFNYVALGHYHKHCKVKDMDRVYYAGSTERLSMAELGQKKGFVEIDLDKDEITFHQVPTRKMIELPVIDASELDPDGVLKEIEKRIETQTIEEEIIRLRVTNIDTYVYNSLNFRAISGLKSRAFHFDLRFEKKEEEKKEFINRTSIGRLEKEFEEYLKNIETEKLDKGKLKELGLKYLTGKEES